MSGRSFVKRVWLSVVVMAVACDVVGAIDTVNRKSTDKRAAGEITEVSRTQITVTPKIGGQATVPANDIVSIEWDGEPPEMGLARSQAAAGQLALAIENYKTAANAVRADKRHLLADIAYGIAAASGKQALNDPEQREMAGALLNEFVAKHSDHYRYFDALLLMGDVQLAAGDSIEAEATFRRLAEAPWPDYQMAADIALGRAALARGDLSAARTAFDKIAEATASTPAEEARRHQAMLGQAMCLQQQDQFSEAAEVLAEVIQQAAAEDTRLQAEAYLRQGDCYAALADKNKEAVMAYLHLDVIPSLASEQDLHAEALYKLSQLWPKLGHPDRADLAAGKLQSQYPSSPWTRKLAGE